MQGDPATQKVLDALQRSRGKGARKQGLRTVTGLAQETGLPAEQVKGVLTSQPELFFLAQLPSTQGEDLFGLRSSAGVPTSVADSGEASDVSEASPIFVVHGHDHAVLHQVVRVLERATSRDVTVLHEQANAGRTILEKFEAHAADASYAVVLLTGDDVGGAVGATPKPRGRQNVIFELGFFFAKLGRKRTAVLLGPGVEEPSDIAGLVYIVIDPGGAWKYALARELSSAGIPIAHERIP
jgi:hypothetical protein